jgi:glycosyltransferase involved in cell wall biosynthesis
MKLSVVIPAYNEEDNIQRAIFDVLEKWADAEVIVVNDASTDLTLELLQQMDHVIVLNNERNMGHGYSVVRGLRAATGDRILYIDADRQIDLRNINTFDLGVDFISGWRVGRHDKLFRKIVSFCLKITNLLWHGMYIRDANCPYKIYRRDSLLPLLDELPKTYVIPIACLEVIARKNGYACATIRTPHKAYDGVRKGFLQLPNKAFFQFCYRAFKETTSL